MTHQVLFVQGGGEGVHDEWDNRLVASLERELGPDYEIRYPRMPDEADPDFAAWKAALKKEFAGLSEGAVLVGHSIGGTILIGALADGLAPRAPRGLILVSAPYIGEGGWPSDEIDAMSDLGSRLPDHLPVQLYHGGEDGAAPIAHAALYKTAIPNAVVHKLPGRDHQLNEDLSEVATGISGLIGAS
jgi:predicted alpha/beta hydrolase family esterase